MEFREWDMEQVYFLDAAGVPDGGLPRLLIIDKERDLGSFIAAARLHFRRYDIYVVWE
jgi:hypothetical protein